MTAMQDPHALFGCRLSAVDDEACQRYLAWLLGEDAAPAPEEATHFTWALAHCDDGVTWGRYDPQAGVWRLGSQVAAHMSPPIRRWSLQELRIFGETKEILIWRTGTGLRGRILDDEGQTARSDDPSDPLRPRRESRILLGDRVVQWLAHGFTHVANRTGAEQVLPVVVTTEQLRRGQVRLLVRHYYESDRDIGAVRIAATRLVRLVSGGLHAA